MKYKYLFPLLLVTLLSSCTQTKEVDHSVYYFSTYIYPNLYGADESHYQEINKILEYYNALSDNYRNYSGITNVNKINSTSEEVTIDQNLYNLLEVSYEFRNDTAFDPLCGSLAKKWKEALNDKTLLSEEVISEELTKMNNSSLLFKDNNVIQRVGDAELDLGGIAKGYVLDMIEDYLKSNNLTHYLINAGFSSILLGEKDNSDGYFSVGVDNRILANSYLKLKNCFVSTSSITEQGVKLTKDGPTYSHIINPLDGSAINKHDAVIVVSNKGYLGDALSTSMMNNTIDEIKEMETKYNVKCIVVDNKSVTYKNTELEVYHH